MAYQNVADIAGLVHEKQFHSLIVNSTVFTSLPFKVHIELMAG